MTSDPEAKTVPVRVLVDYNRGGAGLTCGAVVELEAKLAKDLAKDGIVDADPAAVAYAREQSRAVE